VIVAQRKGYRCVFVCPDKVGEDKPAAVDPHAEPEQRTLPLALWSF
jgi:hypothetical protein